MPRLLGFPCCFCTCDSVDVLRLALVAFFVQPTFDDALVTASRDELSDLLVVRCFDRFESYKGTILSLWWSDALARVVVKVGLICVFDVADTKGGACIWI